MGSARIVGVLLGTAILLGEVAAQPRPIVLSTDAYDDAGPIKMTQDESIVSVSWPVGGDRTGRMEFDLDPRHPLIRSIDMAVPESEQPRQIAMGLDPLLFVRVADRDLAKRRGWTIFFDRVQEKPHQTYLAELSRDRPSAFR